jgi:hypothetical protein
MEVRRSRRRGDAAANDVVMTLGGLLKHMAWVEDYWFTRRLLGRPPCEPWAAVDWDADGD